MEVRAIRQRSQPALGRRYSRNNIETERVRPSRLQSAARKEYIHVPINGRDGFNYENLIMLILLIAYGRTRELVFSRQPFGDLASTKG